MREPDLTRSQLFLDDFWIEDHQRLTHQWHQADIFPEPVLRPEEPWEGTNVTLYGSVSAGACTTRPTSHSRIPSCAWPKAVTGCTGSALL